MKQLLFTVALATTTAFLLFGCSEKSKVDEARALMADSAAKAIILQSVVDDHEMRMEVMHLMIEHMAEDTSMAVLMMHQAQKDKKMAESICNMIASDTTMSEMMRVRITLTPILPARHSLNHTPAVHDKTHVDRDKQQHHYSPDAATK